MISNIGTTLLNVGPSYITILHQYGLDITAILAQHCASQYYQPILANISPCNILILANITPQYWTNTGIPDWPNILCCLGLLAISALFLGQKLISCTYSLSFCCWSEALQTRSSAIAVIADRTACSILTLFIVTATSRPVNKKIRLLSIRRYKNYCGSASAIGSPHASVCTCIRRQGLCY